VNQNQDLYKYIKSLNDHSLHKSVVELAQKERKLNLIILHHIREIFERRLYAKLGYPNIHQYCTQELKYSGGAAQRRISTLKLMQEIPQIENSIREGKLNLTTASTVSNFFSCKRKRRKGEGFTCSCKTFYRLQEIYH